MNSFRVIRLRTSADRPSIWQYCYTVTITRCTKCCTWVVSSKPPGLIEKNQHEVSMGQNKLLLSHSRHFSHHLCVSFPAFPALSSNLSHLLGMMSESQISKLWLSSFADGSQPGTGRVRALSLLISCATGSTFLSRWQSDSSKKQSVTASSRQQASLQESFRVIPKRFVLVSMCVKERETYLQLSS